MENFNIKIIGKRINPGFKSTKALFDNSDLAGIQALAVKQAEAGAAYLNVNIGARAMTDTAFMADVIRAIQEVVTLAVFAPFAVLYFRQPLKWDYLWAGLCMIGAVYFIFRGDAAAKV